jgi:CheY-like chemotaxis protein
VAGLAAISHRKKFENSATPGRVSCSPKTSRSIRSLARTAESAGLVVDLAEDGVAAVELAKGKDYDLILLDLQMPRMNGIEATQIIRALPGRETVPILALTANAFSGDRKMCIDAGMNDHIGKPVDPDQLFETLLKWLSKPV